MSLIFFSLVAQFGRKLTSAVEHADMANGYFGFEPENKTKAEKNILFSIKSKRNKLSPLCYPNESSALPVPLPQLTAASTPPRRLPPPAPAATTFASAQLAALLSHLPLPGGVGRPAARTRGDPPARGLLPSLGGKEP